MAAHAHGAGGMRPFGRRLFKSVRVARQKPRTGACGIAVFHNMLQGQPSAEQLSFMEDYLKDLKETARTTDTPFTGIPLWQLATMFQEYTGFECMPMSPNGVDWSTFTVEGKRILGWITADGEHFKSTFFLQAFIDTPIGVEIDSSNAAHLAGKQLKVGVMAPGTDLRRKWVNRLREAAQRVREVDADEIEAVYDASRILLWVESRRLTNLDPGVQVDVWNNRSVATWRRTPSLIISDAFDIEVTRTGPNKYKAKKHPPT